MKLWFQRQLFCCEKKIKIVQYCPREFIFGQCAQKYMKRDEVLFNLQRNPNLNHFYTLSCLKAGQKTHSVRLPPRQD